MNESARFPALISLLRQGDLSAAEAHIRAIADAGAAAEAWQLLSRAYANEQRWDAAQRAIEAALRLQPRDRALKLERAIIADRLGHAAEALSDLQALAQESEDSPQLLAQLARALVAADRMAEAEATLVRALERWPTDITLHSLLIRLRWLRGCREASTEWLERAIARFPSELQLRLVAADALRNAGLLEKALTLIEGGLRVAPRSAAFLTSVGVVLDDLNRPSDALPYLRAATAQSPSSRAAKRNLLATLLRVAEAQEALSLSDQLLAHAPDDQQLIAHRATALRMLGDPRYGELHDYDRLVRLYEPDPPSGYANIAEFNAAFATAVRALHKTAQHPLDQSLRGGTQTDGSLPQDHPIIAAFFQMIDAPIRDYISRLSAGSDHPTDRRRTASYRFAGSWSVRLSPRGFHVNHVHPKGWLSSAYYIELPCGIEDDPDRAGWLKFGEPGNATPGCTPNHYVRPEPGRLVLFPSYMWHGTVPFTQGGDRLTAAFDVVPAR